MALPTDVKVFAETLGPYDTVEFNVNATPLLESGEAISSYSVTVPTESSLLGLTVNTTGGYTTSITSNVIKFWLSIDVAHQTDSAFTTAGGVKLPLEISVTTDSTPARKKKRTVAVTVEAR